MCSNSISKIILGGEDAREIGSEGRGEKEREREREIAREEGERDRVRTEKEYLFRVSKHVKIFDI